MKYTVDELPADRLAVLLAGITLSAAQSLALHQATCLLVPAIRESFIADAVSTLGASPTDGEVQAAIAAQLAAIGVTSPTFLAA